MGLGGGGDEDRVELHFAPVGQTYAAQLATGGQDLLDRGVHELHPARAETLRGLLVDLTECGSEEHEIIAPLPDELGLVQ